MRTLADELRRAWRRTIRSGYGDPTFRWRTSGIAAAYFACATLTLQLTRFGGGLAVVWLAGAVLFACLISSPRRQWIAITIACVPGAIIASALFGIGGRATTPLAAISLIEAYGAAWFLKRFCPRFGHLHSVEEVVRFLAITGAVVPAAGATCAAWVALLSRGIPFVDAWTAWYVGHALGLVAFAPPILLLLKSDPAAWAKALIAAGPAKTLGLFGAVTSCMLLTFCQAKVPLVALPFVPMIFATFRLGQIGAVVSIVLLVAIGLSFSLAGIGPTTLVHGGLGLQLQVLQIYMATIVLILLPVAAELKTRRRLLDRLQASAALHRLMLESASDIVLRVSVDGVIRYASPATSLLWGYEAADVVGTTGSGIIDEGDIGAVDKARQRACAFPAETILVEYGVTRRDGSHMWVESHSRATLDEDGAPVGTVSIIREITARKRRIAELEIKASTDALTGLLNRGAFDEALEAHLQGMHGDHEYGCLALFDLDRFKQVNDQYGHPVGDAILKSFAHIVVGSIREEDVVARVGGEEFAILMIEATLDQAYGICERIRLRLEAEHHDVHGAQVRCTVSVGVTPLIDRNAEGAVRTADAALYGAKRAGRNQIVVLNGIQSQSG